MFGRNWREPADYQEIAEYPPLRQAWEFLRRKPSYQLDCRVALEIRSWINGLPFDLTMRAYDLARGYNLPGEDFANIMQNFAGHGVKITPEIENKIKKLTAAEVLLLFANSGEWLAPRHNLSDFPRDLPVMPTENEPEGLDNLFKHCLGGDIITSQELDFPVQVPAQHAAIIVDLEQPISDQLDGIVRRAKKLQTAKQRAASSQRGTAKKKSRPFPRLPKYIRLLDALEEKGPEFPRKQDLYPFFKPKKNNKTSPDQVIGDLLQPAKRFRDKDYNILAWRGQAKYWTEFGR